MINQIIAPAKKYGAHEIEVTMRKKKGKHFFTHLSLSLQRNSDNKVIGMLGYSMDITERKLTEQKLHRLNDELEQPVQQRTEDLRRSVSRVMQEIEVP